MPSERKSVETFRYRTNAGTNTTTITQIPGCDALNVKTYATASAYPIFFEAYRTNLAALRDALDEFLGDKPPASPATPAQVVEHKHLLAIAVRVVEAVKKGDLSAVLSLANQCNISVFSIDELCKALTSLK